MFYKSYGVIKLLKVKNVKYDKLTWLLVFTHSIAMYCKNWLANIICFQAILQQLTTICHEQVPHSHFFFSILGYSSKGPGVPLASHILCPHRLSLCFTISQSIINSLKSTILLSKCIQTLSVWNPFMLILVCNGLLVFQGYESYFYNSQLENMLQRG